MGMCNAQAVWLRDKLYVGGGSTSESVRNDARLMKFVHIHLTSSP